MKCFLLVAFLLALSSSFSSQTPARDATRAPGLVAPASPARLHTVFRGDGVHLQPDRATGTSAGVAMRLASWGRGDLVPGGGASPAFSRNGRVEYDRGDVVEWYVREARGVEQGFTILASPPACSASRDLPLRLTLALTGVDEIRSGVDGRSLLLLSADGLALTYSGVRAWDAGGRALDARLASEGGEIVIRVDDRGALYPVSVDPWIAIERARLTSARSTHFGANLAFDDDTVIALHHPSRGTGIAFARSGGTWHRQGELSFPSDPTTYPLWTYLALSGDTAVIGGHGAGGQGLPTHVLVRDGSRWSLQAEIPPLPLLVSVGTPVAIDGDTLLIGEPTDRAPLGVSTGSVHVYVREGTSWNLQAVLVPSDAAWHDRFGSAVALDGDTAVIGAQGRFVSGMEDVGAAYAFVRRGTTWKEEASFPAPEPREDGAFGRAVAVSGLTVAITTPEADAAGIPSAGACYLYDRRGTTWTPGPKLIANDAAPLDRFGTSVDLHGNRLVVGAKGEDDVGHDAGAAYLFVRSGSIWKEQSKLTASNGRSGDWFGSAVGIEDSTILVGSPFAAAGDGAEPREGVLHVFDLQPDAHTVARDAPGNYPGLAALSRPVLGEDYRTSVHKTFGYDVAWVAGYAGPASVPLPDGQWILVDHRDPWGELLRQPIVSLPGQSDVEFTVPIPPEPQLAGLEVFTQGLALAPPGYGLRPYVLTNAQDLFLGYE